MKFIRNPEFDRVIASRGLAGAFRVISNQTELASYILHLSEATNEPLQCIMTALIYDKLPTNQSDDWVMRLLRTSHPNASCRFLEGNLLNQHRHISPELCDRVITHLDEVEPKWWRVGMRLSVQAVADHGEYLMDVVPGAAWSVRNWEDWSGGFAPLHAHATARINATGCDPDLGRKLFMEQYDQKPSQRVSLNKFCEILTSLNTALVS
jgi:hypothetical protein